VSNFYRLIQGDCLEVLQKMQNNSIDLIVTSPPYFNSGKKYQRGSGVHYSMDVGEPLYLIPDCSEILFSKLRNDGFYCLNLGFSYSETGILRPFYIVQRLLKLGWFCIDVIFWHKLNPIPIQKRLTNSIEYIFVLSKHPLSEYPSKPNYKHNFLESSIASSEGFSSAPFPEELPKFCIETFSLENDMILDPFLGSGTTMAACQDLGRNCIGVEVSPEYCEVVRKRCFGRRFLDREVEYSFEVFGETPLLGASV